MTAVFAQAGYRLQGSLADLTAVKVDARHPGLGGERNERGGMGRKIATAKVVPLLSEHDNGSAFRSFVSQRRKLRGTGEVSLFDSGRGEKFGRGAVSESDRSGFVQSQHIHVARRFDSTSRHRDDVSLNHAIHAGNADCGQKTSNGRGNQANEK